MFQIDDSFQTSEGMWIARLTVTPDQLRAGDFVNGNRLRSAESDVAVYEDGPRTVFYLAYEDSCSDFVGPEVELLVERMSVCYPTAA